MNRDPKDWPGGFNATGEPLQNAANTKAVADRRAARQKAKPLQDTAASHLRNALQISECLQTEVAVMHTLKIAETERQAALAMIRDVNARICAALAILEGKETMTRINDDDIAAEDGPSIGAPRTREEWDQVFRALDDADRIPSLAVLPDFSTKSNGIALDLVSGFDGLVTKSHNEDGVRVIDRVDLAEVSLVPVRAELRSSDDPITGGVQFAFRPSRDLPKALTEGEQSRDDWARLRMDHPIVARALEDAQVSEELHRRYGATFRCDGCLSAGDLTTFPWAGALFVHLLTCPHFAKTVE